jgi:hypothetical protein
MPMLANVGYGWYGYSWQNNIGPTPFKPTMTMPTLDQRRHKLHGPGWLKALGHHWPNGQVDVGSTSFANVGLTYCKSRNIRGH